MLLVGCGRPAGVHGHAPPHRADGRLRDQKLKLEREAEERNRELVELSTHLQNVAEREKASLARELHDELGGLLVGARMDISWAEQHLAEGDSDMRQRLQRVQQNLSAGVDIKRRIIEELRPHAIGQCGVVRGAALATEGNLRERRPQMHRVISRGKNPSSPPGPPSPLFRIAQEAFTNILKHSAAKTVDITVNMDAEGIGMQISDDGTGIPRRAGSRQPVRMASLPCAIGIRALGGRLDVRSPASGGTVLLVQIPLAAALMGADDPAPI